MLTEIVVNPETGRVGLKVKNESISKTLWRRRVKLSERKQFFESLNVLYKDVSEAQEKGDEDAALEGSISLILAMLEGIEKDEFYEVFDVHEVRELAEATRELMENGGKGAKKNA